MLYAEVSIHTVKGTQGRTILGTMSIVQHLRKKETFVKWGGILFIQSNDEFPMGPIQKDVLDDSDYQLL